MTTNFQQAWVSTSRSWDQMQGQFLAFKKEQNLSSKFCQVMLMQAAANLNVIKYLPDRIIGL